MHATLITVSLPTELLGAADRAVAGGAAESLSAFIADALRTQLSRVLALTELERALGGRPPKVMLDRVRSDLGITRK